MPKLPWVSITEVPPDTEVTIMGSKLPLRKHRDIPRFLLATMRIRKQLARSEGLVGYALDAQLVPKTFWTMSAWVGKDELWRFARANPHHAQTSAIKPKMQPTTFVFWSGTAEDLPVAWRDVRARIADHQTASDSDG